MVLWDPLWVRHGVVGGTLGVLRDAVLVVGRPGLHGNLSWRAAKTMTGTSSDWAGTVTASLSLCSVVWWWCCVVCDGCPGPAQELYAYALSRTQQVSRSARKPVEGRAKPQQGPRLAQSGKYPGVPRIWHDETTLRANHHAAAIITATMTDHFDGAIHRHQPAC